MDVLVVDDTPVNLEVMVALLRHLPQCQALPFANPLTALDWCLAHEVDLIVVDYRMPEMDGLEFIRRVRHHRGHESVPILMVTSDHERSTRYEALKAGATDFLNKPIDRHEFDPRVRNMLALRAAYLSERRRATDLAQEVRKATGAIRAREQETILRLARAAEFRDPETGAHLQRMAAYSALIAETLQLGSGYTDELLHAAPMHDLGKIGIPDHILLKPGRLDPAELTVMQRHPLIGHELLKDSTSPVMQMAARIALSHHERYDGHGYPHRLSGEAIPLEGRIVAVADVFDALSSERPYKRAWPLEDAFRFLEAGSGSHFDPLCVNAFLRRRGEVLDIRARVSETGLPPVWDEDTLLPDEVE